MKLVKVLFLFFFLTFGSVTSACECGSQGDFLKVATKTSFVALVKVTKYLSFKDIYKDKTPLSMEVEIISVYKGTEKRKKVVVWGDNGILCRPYLSKFKIGNYYVIAFDSAPKTSRGLANESEKATDYAISICGEYWLDANIKSKVAQSTSTEYKTLLPLNELKSKLAS